MDKNQVLDLIDKELEVYMSKLSFVGAQDDVSNLDNTIMYLNGQLEACKRLREEIEKL